MTGALEEDHEALYAAALAHRDANTRRRRHRGGGRRGGPDRLATIPWSTLGPEGEARLAESAVTVRCLTMPDGSVPASECDDGVLAVVGRAY